MTSLMKDFTVYKYPKKNRHIIAAESFTVKLLIPQGFLNVLPFLTYILLVATNKSRPLNKKYLSTDL